MKMEYKRTWNQSLMILKEIESYEGYETKMLEYNKIDGLLPMEQLIEDGQISYSYNITGKKALDYFLEQKNVEAELLKNLLCRCIHVCREIEKYLLNENHLLMELNTIFIDNETEEIYFCYQPGKTGFVKDSFRGLLEVLLQKLNHDKEENIKIAYDLYQKTLEENYSFLDLQKIFYKEQTVELVQKAEAYDTEIYETIEQTEDKKPEKRIAVELLKEVKKWIEKKTPKRQTKKEESVEYLAELEKKEEPIARLMYLGRGEGRDFWLEQENFLLGTDEEFVNGVLCSAAVEKIHAKIKKMEDGYYIEDMNSKNGTMVNGEILVYKNAQKLKEGDRITFADVSYRFLTF